MEIRQIQIGPGGIDPDALRDLATLQPELVLCFADADHLRSPALAAAICDTLPHALVAGCSTAGEISARGVTTAQAIITAIKPSQASFVMAHEAAASMDDSEAAGERLGRQLASRKPHSALVLGQGVALNGSALIRGLRRTLGEHVALFGGLAADGGRFERTFVMHGRCVSEHDIVAIGICAPQIQIRNGTFGGWRAFGPARQVTRARGNVLLELDGQPALDVYKRYLGEHAAQLPGCALLFPFAMVDENLKDTGVIRTILGIDEATGSLTLAGEVKDGGALRLMCASSDDLINGAEMAAERAVAADRRGAEESLGLLVSCVGRKMVLGTRVDEEVEAVAAILGDRCTLAGFYSNGEISSCGAGMGHHDHLYNQTMTVTWLTEAA